MDSNRELACTETSDDYYVTALQIFEYCGAKTTEKLRVDALMDKFAPFVKSNKAEFSCLKAILDPGHCNPDIDVTTLAMALNQNSESHRTKVDLDESFNLRNGQLLHDSDSGISTDGFQMLEELREKAHEANQLRLQLQLADRHHEEALAALCAERDDLKAHLTMLRDENTTLTHLKYDYDDVCERLAGSELTLAKAKDDLDCAKRKVKILQDQVIDLENELLSRQELLSKSKAECHRINEMYATRQSALLEENETLKAEHADLSAKLQDQGEFMQQVIKEKLTVETELKDMLDKSNQTHMRMDRSIDCSYNDEQYLNTIDGINADTRFSSDYVSISTQADVACPDCTKRDVVVPRKGIRRHLWDPVKCLFQTFAVICFVFALSALYGASRRWQATCERAHVPWRWLHAQELIDLLFHIEYVSDVPM